jgi:hypothetical protein
MAQQPSWPNDLHGQTTSLAKRPPWPNDLHGQMTRTAPTRHRNYHSRHSHHHASTPLLLYTVQTFLSSRTQPFSNCFLVPPGPPATHHSLPPLEGMSSSVSAPPVTLANVLYTQDLVAFRASLKLEHIPSGCAKLIPSDERYSYARLEYDAYNGVKYVLTDDSNGALVNSRATPNGAGAHRALWQLKKPAVGSTSTARCEVWCVCVSFVSFTVALVISFVECVECLNACL